MQAVTLVVAGVVMSLPLAAQFRAPVPERKTPRAIGVLETYKNGSRRLLPVTFFYEKHYYDAAAYHATPVPFTLYSETVYEVQQFGKPLGTFTVQSATTVQGGPQTTALWFGNGKFKLAPNPELMAKKKAEAPVVLEDPSKPVLRRRAGSEGDKPAARPVAAEAKPEVEEDPDRPKLHRKEGSGGESAAPGQTAGAGQTGTGQTTTAEAKPESQPESSQQDPNRPKLHRKDDSEPAKKAGATAPGAGAVLVVGETEASSGEEPDHPVLRRGKPVQAQGGSDLPDFKREEPVSRQVAVSDAGPSEAQTLIYVCPEEERQRMEEQARELAQAELRRLGAQRGLVLPAAKTAPAMAAKVTRTAAGAKKVAAPAALPLQEEQFIPYDLDYNNYATVVYSARYSPTADSATPVKPKSWVVTVIAREDENKLVKLYSAVSDPRELDLYPEVRLVDAVDPDGYGRMALLLREKKRDGVSWLVGRPTGYELQTVFETPSR